jgi:hypothetical protein
MLIDQVYQLVNFVSNKEQRGNITPSDYNTLAEMAQREFVSRRLGNLKQIGKDGLPLYGYEQSWRVHEDLQQMIAGPEQIPIGADGTFVYPVDYVHVDSVQTIDNRPIKRITNDQYPALKRSSIVAPSVYYPVVIFRHPKGFVDPYGIGSIAMTFLRHPPKPVWAYTVVNDSPVYDQAASTDFTVNYINANELAMIILAHVGINLNAEAVSNYALSKDAAGT